MENDQLNGGVAVITGAAGGLGEGLAHVAGEKGMKLVLADISAEALDRAVSTLKAKGVEAQAVVTDVADSEAIDRLAAATLDLYGPARLLINNAGIETLGLAWELSAKDWARTFNINVMGVINGCRAFAPQMLAAGQQAYIVNVASIAAVSMMGIQTPYIVSKHAVLSFSECLKLEMDMQETPIQVSAVLPGPVATRIFQDASGAQTPSVSRHREIMHQSIHQGMSPMDAAREIFAQILAGQFWVSPHLDMLAEAARARGQYLTAMETPALSDAGRHLMTL